MLLVTLDFRILHLATNQTLSVKDSVFRVGVEGVLGGVTDPAEMNAPLGAQPWGTRQIEDSQSFLVREGDP